MSVIDDINKRRTRQSVGEQPAAAPVEPVAPVAQPMGDQANARVSQGENGKLKGESPTELNPTAEQKAVAKMLVNPAAPQAAAVPQVSAPAVEPVTTYTDIAKRINPELDAEAKAKREKQLRTKKQVAAIGDAISALANMHYTGTSGVNAYDPSATLSGKAKENYDKFLADVKSYEDAHKAAMLRGAELNAAATEARRKEAVADARYKEQAATAAENAKQTQKNYSKREETKIKSEIEELKTQLKNIQMWLNRFE